MVLMAGETFGVLTGSSLPGGCQGLPQHPAPLLPIHMHTNRIPMDLQEMERLRVYFRAMCEDKATALCRVPVLLGEPLAALQTPEGSLGLHSWWPLPSPSTVRGQTGREPVKKHY